MVNIAGRTYKHITFVIPPRLDPAAVSFSRPPTQVGLAIEGGGMRGCVSAGMIAAVSTLGLMDTFDAVYGSSAGSLVGAYAIAGQVC